MIAISMNKVVLLCFLFLMIFSLDYDKSHTVACTKIPTTSLTANLQYLWPKLILHVFDWYAFLICCPIIFILQLILFCTYLKFTNLLNRPGSIFFGILIIQMVLNLRLLISAIYLAINNQYGPFPSNFEAFCTSIGIISTFFILLHSFYLILFYIYVIFSFRFRLRKKSEIFWKTLHGVIIFGSALITFFLWMNSFIGLNYDGLCSVAFTRNLSWNVALPSIMLAFAILFSILGIFTYFYFQKHMPSAEGFQRRKYNDSKIIGMYVFGFSLYNSLLGIFGIITSINCESSNPLPSLTVFSTIVNVMDLLQFFFLIYLIIKNNYFRYKLKKMLRGIFQKHTERSDSNLSQFRSDFLEMQELVFNEQLLEIKEASNQIDLLLISQIYTLISSVYITFVQYFKHQEMQEIKHIHYLEKTVFSLDNSCAINYDSDILLLSKLKILRCQVIIFAPKIFRNLQRMDGLKNIEESFHIYENSKKMHNLVEGKGGKSGQFFFFSADNKYVIKTITLLEFQFLKQNLQAFYEYYKKNPLSLLAKIYGLFIIKGDQMQRTYRFILMKNILGCERRQVRRTYDMKGSKYDRQVIKKDISAYNIQKQTLKDTDFMKLQGKIRIDSNFSSTLRDTLREDTFFLKSLNLIDYSLLLVKVQWKKQPQNPFFWSPLQRIKSLQVQREYYHIGIIDYMQKWDFQKKGQKWWKNLLGKKDVSAEEPNRYQNRFMVFIDEIAMDLPLNEKEIEQIEMQSMKEKKKTKNSEEMKLN